MSWCHLCEDLKEVGEEAVRTSGDVPSERTVAAESLRQEST